MKIGRAMLGLGAAGASCAVFALAACSSSSGRGPQGTSDATTVEGSSSEDASPTPEGSSPPEDGATKQDSASDAAQESSTEAGTPDGGADASDGATGDGSTCAPVDAGTPDGASAEAGSALANMTKSFFPAGPAACAQCHGMNFSGGILVGGATSKNLTPDPATGLGCWTDAQIVAAILSGVTPDGETLCVMPKWITYGMTADQAEDIVEYLRTLPPVVNQVAPTVCPGSSDAGSDAGDAQIDASGSD
jgi:hypothetical protein